MQRTIKTGFVLVVMGAVSMGNAFAAAPAFPGAEGYGAKATGGRGGRVLIVDSIEDDPKDPAPGTFRWACESESGPRVVVFRRGGLIELAREVVVKNGDLTIAAQTAPGAGVCLKGAALSIEASNVIVRGLRSRAGDGEVGPSGQKRRSLQIIGPVSDVIVDHCSLSWGVDDNITVYADVEGNAPGTFTIQWCLISEGLYRSIHQQGPHSMAMTMGGGNIGPFSLHHNLLTHNNGRNPRIVWGAQGELINNVIYNWGGEATILEPVNPTKILRDKRRPGEGEERPARLNFIGNSWIEGPDSTRDRAGVHLKRATEGTAIYLKGNVGPNFAGTDATGKNEAAVLNGDRKAIVDRPAMEPSGVQVASAVEGKESVLASAGAIAPVRDAVDRRVVDGVREGKGAIIDSPAQVGGYPDYPAGEAGKDSDGDGMPDGWEIERGLDARKANANDRSLDPEYDAIEVYVNGLLPR